MADSLVGHCVRFTMAIIHHLFFFSLFPFSLLSVLVTGGINFNI